MTARVQDIPWLSELEMAIIPSRKHRRSHSAFLGISVDVPVSSSSVLSPRSFNLIMTPGSTIPQFSTMPPEIMYNIFDKLCIKDTLHLSETCKYFYQLIDCTSFWRQRLITDFKCCSFSIWGSCEKREPDYREVYKMVYWADNDDEPYEEMF